MSSRLKLKRKIKRFIKTKGYISPTTIALFCIVVLLVVLFGAYELLLLPKIDLKGKNEVVINYKDKYVEKGYKATLLGDDITSDVKLTG